MMVSQFVLETLGSLLQTFSPTPFDAFCPHCGGDLRWVKFFGRVKRIRCADCKREWEKDGARAWSLDVPHNPT